MRRLLYATIVVAALAVAPDEFLGSPVELRSLMLLSLLPLTLGLAWSLARRCLRLVSDDDAARQTLIHEIRHGQVAAHLGLTVKNMSYGPRGGYTTIRHEDGAINRTAAATAAAGLILPDGRGEAVGHSADWEQVLQRSLQASIEHDTCFTDELQRALDTAAAGVDHAKAAALADTLSRRSFGVGDSKRRVRTAALKRAFAPATEIEESR